MTESMSRVAAALAGVPAGVQAIGPWAGRRQLFVRFAGEAETATMYGATALVREIDRQLGRSAFHSIVIGGRDPLGNVPFLHAALGAAKPRVPVMLDTDGQRPQELADVLAYFAMIQVTVDFTGGEASFDHVIASLAVSAKHGTPHALVLIAREDTPDSLMLRLIEEARRTTASVRVVIHPFMNGDSSPSLDRRWATLLEHAMAMHADVRLFVRVPAPTGLR